MTLTHWTHTDWADASGDPEPQFGGLTEFGEEVVKEINMPNNEINKILLFLRNDFINNKNEIYDKQIIHYLEKYNASLLEINKNKGLKLLCKLNYPSLQYCFDEEY